MNTRINSKGRIIDSNYGVTQISETAVRCNGCGREFLVTELPWHTWAWQNSQGRRLNLARAQSHADRCKGITCQWFALCDRPAEGTVAHPVLGDVPCCRRCAKRAGEELRSGEIPR